MVQGQTDNHDISTGKKRSRSLWIVILVFIIFVAIVFFNEQQKKPIAWVEDYNAGIELAKQQNKPALICFFKQQTNFSSQMWENVYSKSSVRKYVEANFVPILIDVDKHPEIARRYNITYYPTHYVERPNTNQTDGPFIGEHRLFDFIKRMGEKTTH